MRYAPKEFDEGVELIKTSFFDKNAKDYLLRNFDF